MAKISINNESIEILKSGDGKLSIDGNENDYNLIRVSKNYYHLLLNNKSYRIELLENDQIGGSLQLKINGRLMQGRIAYRIEQVLKSMGMDSGKKIQKDIKAPMPGLVLDVLVEAGQEVNEGDDLIILEAMKMENALKAPQAGVIASVSVSKQDKVDKNQLLVSYK